ncbi:hypothetical protein CYY_004216 [Polysphondylium violaceum]|uniref:Thioredoxin domain-containing protein n=1 Tax=Polysphondylium violaceum TaxID=133409 RepID=A0A8J4Q5T0_9MYCE|nr:hypothetical protein CYY_004216 [Polysphondylium violaceum]
MYNSNKLINIASNANKYIFRAYCTGTPSAASSSSTGGNLRIGDVVPDFSQESSMGNINLYKYLGDSWGILFSHPKDFTPVCTTELGRVAKLKPEFEKRNTKVIALSVDSGESHKEWIKDIQETQNVPSIDYPIIADADKKVANLYGMIHPNAANNMTIRSVYFIGPEKKLRAQITLPASTGRSFVEILRIIDSLQLTDKHKVATPAEWKDGDDCVIIPTISDQEAKGLFPKGWKALKSYLRMTPQPNKK